MIEDLNKIHGAIGEYIIINGAKWAKYELTKKREIKNLSCGILNKNELIINSKYSVFIIHQTSEFLFISPNKDVLFIYAKEKEIEQIPPIDKKRLIAIFERLANNFNVNLDFCK